MQLLQIPNAGTNTIAVLPGVVCYDRPRLPHLAPGIHRSTLGRVAVQPEKGLYWCERRVVLEQLCVCLLLSGQSIWTLEWRLVRCCDVHLLRGNVREQHSWYVGDEMIDDSAKVHDAMDDFIKFLQFGYGVYGVVPISSIEKIADLIYTVDIMFDGEFKTLCHEWAYRHEVDPYV